MRRTLALSIRAAACAWLLGCGLAAAQQVTLSKDSTLHTEPNAAAAPVAQLKEGTAGEVIARKGAWVQLKSAAGTGWVYAFNVNYGSAGAGAAPAAASSQRRQTTSTIGIRGLEKEDLKNATFDGKQLDALDSFAK
ncbi:MAG TPA: hypothetical protein VED01_02180 [Burkholderiales bacterium]|nr:hypothetical protein [Burkholderiales bacterium]